MAGAAGHRPCDGVLVLGRIECTTGPHWRGINGLAERKGPGALETRVQRIPSLKAALSGEAQC